MKLLVSRRWSKPQKKSFSNIIDKEKRKFLDRIIQREPFTSHNTGREEEKSKWRGNNLFLMKWLM